MVNILKITIRCYLKRVYRFHPLFFLGSTQDKHIKLYISEISIKFRVDWYIIMHYAFSMVSDYAR